jgi:kinesin family protein 20
VVPIDPSWTYRISVSYAEIYNNQIYDLLNTAPSTSESQVKATTSKSSVINTSPSASSNVRFLPTSILNLNPFSWIGGGGGGISHASRQNVARGSITTVSRQALTLRSDPLRGGKYIANLSEVPVSSAEEARKVMVMGQVNRRVFGTVANKESSRSHAVFTIRVERLKRDLKNVSVQTAILGEAHNTALKAEAQKNCSDLVGNRNSGLWSSFNRRPGWFREEQKYTSHWRTYG